MSTSTHTAAAQLELGTKAVAIAFDTLRIVVAAAIAWSFTTWWSIALAFIAAYLAALAACLAVGAVVDHFYDATPALTAIGGAAFTVSDTVRGWFSRAPKAVA